MHLYPFFSNSLKLPKKFYRLEFRFHQAKFHLQIGKNYLRAYFIIKEETFIPGSLTE
jgi:hypothetical protein